MPVNCTDAIYSNEYYDYIINTSSVLELEQFEEEDACLQSVDRRFLILYRRGEQNGEDADFFQSELGYNRIPKCFGLMETENLEASGVGKLRRQPFLNYSGRGVLVGFVDTGIDYQNPLFQREDGTSRIAAIWDQTESGGMPPENFLYGREYRNEEITEAILSEEPLRIVPEVDTDGHGTYLAGIAAGNRPENEEFSGIAYESEIVMVKLKEAKDNLKQYFGIPTDRKAYSEADIMLGVKYLVEVAGRLRRPLVICIGLGSSQGNHTGQTALGRYLESFTLSSGISIISAAGNEGDRGHHYGGEMLSFNEEETVEFQVAEGESGFTMEVWTSVPSFFNLELISPLGETTGVLSGRLSFYAPSKYRFQFALESVEVFIETDLVEQFTGQQVILIRLRNPTEGIWQLRLLNMERYESRLDIWMPIENFLNPDTRFLRPDPDITICEPGNNNGVITVSAYEYRNNSLYVFGSRGYTEEGDIKPDIAAPGVNITGPVPGIGETEIRFENRSGTSVAAAHVAGCAALLLEWGIYGNENAGPLPELLNTQIKTYLIRGATRIPGVVFPNREWGYGSLNIFDTFALL
ncbi:MAG: S8 family peptidase [Lachnospiraceae bacterium]|nr:S8 family peptidase [Lachnospiraceae bacterium]